MTASSMPSTCRSARRSAWSPSASMPSSLVSRTRTDGAGYSVRSGSVVAGDPGPGALELVAQVVGRGVVRVGRHDGRVLGRLGQVRRCGGVEREDGTARV